MPDSKKQSRRDKTSGKEQGQLINLDERLLADAGHNPSLAGRELLTEILARGPEPEETERPRATDVRAALQSRSLDDPDYRTAAEQADWLGKESQEMRDLYERGAMIKGETLVIPAEGYELREENEQPFITSLSYAHEHISHPEHAAEFHALGRVIAGEMTDARGEIETFRFYYDRLNRDQSGRRLRQDQTTEREAALTRTLAEMRAMAAVMRQLETQRSIEVVQPVGSLEQVRDTGSSRGSSDEEASGLQYKAKGGSYNLEEQVGPPEFGAGQEIEAVSYSLNTSARKVRLDAESLRLPARLSFEAKERLVAQTLPAIDRKLESGTSREVIFAAIDGHQRKLNEARQGGPEERDEWFRIGGFIKAYVDERLHDPETRELNRSAEFREAHAEISAARTPKELSRAAERFLRENSERSQSLRRHRDEPDKYPAPAPLPLDARQRQLLFYGRSPEHFSPEMRELKFNWGLSREERAVQVQLLREGQLEPSPTLKLLLRELESRHSVKAVAHYQAAILNEKLENPGKLNLRSLHESLAPHERNYSFDRVQERKQMLARSPSPGQRAGADGSARDMNTVLAATGRAFGQLPAASDSYRDYMAAMGVVERQMLNEAVRRRRGITASDERLTGELRPLSITEARALLPFQEQAELRQRARNLAWEFVAPPEVFARNPSPAALRLSDAIAHTQEHLQERARTAHAAREQFIHELVSPAEKRLAEERGRAAYLKSFSAKLQELKRDWPKHDGLKSAGAVALREGTTAQRLSTSFDPQGVPVGLRREVVPDNDSINSRKLSEEYASREVDLAKQAHQAGLAALSETRKRPLFGSREEQERFTQGVLTKLVPADAHKLAELDTYAAKAREELYRGFEVMDVLRRDLELSRHQQPSDLTQATSEMPRELESIAAALPNLTTAENLKVKAEDLAEETRQRTLGNEQNRPLTEQRLGYVDSRREWHYESLRDILGSNQRGDRQDALDVATFHQEHQEIEHER